MGGETPLARGTLLQVPSRPNPPRNSIGVAPSPTGAFSPKPGRRSSVDNGTTRKLSLSQFPKTVRADDPEGERLVTRLALALGQIPALHYLHCKQLQEVAERLEQRAWAAAGEVLGRQGDPCIGLVITSGTPGAFGIEERIPGGGAMASSIPSSPVAGQLSSPGPRASGPVATISEVQPFTVANPWVMNMDAINERSLVALKDNATAFFMPRRSLVDIVMILRRIEEKERRTAGTGVSKKPTLRSESSKAGVFTNLDSMKSIDTAPSNANALLFKINERARVNTFEETQSSDRSAADAASCKAAASGAAPSGVDEAHDIPPTMHVHVEHSRSRSHDRTGAFGLKFAPAHEYGQQPGTAR